MEQSGDGDIAGELKNTIGKWLALDRAKQMEVWENVGFDLILGIARLDIALLGRVEEIEKRLEQLERR